MSTEKPRTIEEYRQLAEKKMDPAAWCNIDCGSGDELTLKANVESFNKIWIRPRVLVDVENCRLDTAILGTNISMPIFIAPTGAHTWIHPEGETATVKAAGTANTVYVISSSATRTFEDIAKEASGPLWFQLYVYKDKKIAEQFVKRAEIIGCKAFVLTVDTPRYGKKERFNFHYSQPTHIRKANFEGLPENSDLVCSLTWKDFDWLRSITKLPIIMKGVLTSEDAQLAIEHGASGIIVSNHGGRQLDSVISTIEALPEIVHATQNRVEVYVDGGIRKGTDIFKALALGAKAVLVGRPILWGLSVNGAEGVKDVLEILKDELENTMVLAGCPTLDSINSSFVKTNF